LISVFGSDGKAVAQTAIPSALLAPIRLDVVKYVHTNINKNHRQPYAVKWNAGEQTSAESWGTGRAVARIPRVPGGGTHRSGQAAFGNMCRGGRMYAPTKTWRRWHRKVSTDQKRYAIVSALAATAVPALVMARGHIIDNVPEVPLVVATGAIKDLTKTKQALALLKSLGAQGDIDRVVDSKRLRAGKGKARNRRYVQKLGPLVIFNERSTLTRAFRNIPGVDLVSVTRLNLLKLAPGGHLGRFVVWTQDAIERVESIYGSTTVKSKEKSNYHLPHPLMLNTDLSRIINSTEVQVALKAKKAKAPRTQIKKNPLSNLKARTKLDPSTIQRRRLALLAAASAEARRKKAVEARKKFLTKRKAKGKPIGVSKDFVKQLRAL
jgi:large subunit ribosomal protein L4e